MKKDNRYCNCLKYGVPALSGLVFALYAWIRLSSVADMLYAAQEHSLWMSGSQFFNDMLQQPGGILSWAGCYLTQYFYHPTAGISLLIGLWLLCYGLLVWGSKMRWWLTPLALLPFLPFLWAVTAPGYFIYHLKLADWWFTPTLYLLSFSLLIVLFRCVRFKYRVGIQALLFIGCLLCIDSWGRESRIPAELCQPFPALSDDANFLAELRMERAAIEGNWSAITQETRKTKTAPTRQMLIFQDIALLNQGRLTEDWLNYPIMTQLPQLPDSLSGNHIKPMVEIGGPRIYFTHGCTQFAYRWSMEEMVEYGPSVRNLRQMAECALIGGEYDAVRKYTGILKQTTFHRAEAEELEQLALHPEKIAEDRRYKYPLTLSKSQENIMDSDNGQCENYLWAHYSTLINGNQADINRLCLHFAMQTQDIGHFWNQFFAYAHLHQSEPMPRTLQEAAYLYCQLEPQRYDINKFPFDKEIGESYGRFTQTTQMYLRLGKNEKQIGEATKAEFGHSFYWFYYFCRHQETY